MEFGYTDEEERFRKRLSNFLDRELTEEIARQNWEDKGLGVEGREFGRRLAANGFLGMSWPRKYGGQGLPITYEFILLEELGRRWGAHVPPDIGYTMVGHTILRHGSEEMKQEFIPRILKGEIEFCLGYSEPEAGSDLASINMLAVEDGDEYVINGQKVFSTEAHYADYHWLAARTDPLASPKHRGISLFIVDMNAPGITIRPMWTMSGERTNEVFYDNVRVPKSRMVGEKNRGFYYMMEAIDSERNMVFIPTRLYFLLDEMVRYAKETKHGERRLADDPLVRQKLAQIAIELDVAKILADRSKWMEANELAMTYEPEVTKIVTSELEQRMVSSLIQILDLFGQLEEDSKWAPLRGRIEWYYLHSFMTTIGAGTSEVGRNVIATRGLGLPRSY